MHRKFIAIVLGAALAVTGLSTTPVRAGDRGDTAAIIAGVAALAIIGAAVSNDRKHDRRKDYVTRSNGHHYKNQNRRYQQKRYYRQERRHQQRHSYNRGHRTHQGYDNRSHRAQRSYDNRGHRAQQNANRGYNRYTPQAQYRRDHNGR